MTKSKINISMDQNMNVARKLCLLGYKIEHIGEILEFESLYKSIQKHFRHYCGSKSGSPCETRGWQSTPINRVPLPKICIQHLALPWLAGENKHNQQKSHGPSWN